MLHEHGNNHVVSLPNRKKEWFTFDPHCVDFNTVLGEEMIIIDLH